MLLAPHQFMRRATRHNSPPKDQRKDPNSDRNKGLAPVPDMAPEINPEQRQRVLRSLHQLESLNLDRPHGVFVGSGAVLQEEERKKLPPVDHEQQTHEKAHSPVNKMAVHNALKAQDAIDELLTQRRTFSKEAMKLRKRVTRVVSLVSNLSVHATQNRLLQELRNLPSLHEHIMQAMETHNRTQRQKLRDVKTALQMLRRSVESGGVMGEKEMMEVLKRLGSEKLLDLVAISDHADAPTLAEHINTCHDVWVEADVVEKNKAPQRRKSPLLRKSTIVIRDDEEEPV